MSSHSDYNEFSRQSFYNELLAHGYEPEYLPESDFYDYERRGGNEKLPYIEGRYTKFKVNEKKIIQEAYQINAKIEKAAAEKNDPVLVENLKKEYEEKLKALEILREDYSKQTPIIPDQKIRLAPRLGKYLFENPIENLIGDEEYQECLTPDYDQATKAIRASNSIERHDEIEQYEATDKETGEGPIKISGLNLIKMAIIANGDEPLAKSPCVTNTLSSLADLTKSLGYRSWESVDKNENPEYKFFEESTRIHKIHQASKTPLSVIALKVLERCLQDNNLCHSVREEHRQVYNVVNAIKVGRLLQNLDTTKEKIKEINSNPDNRKIENIYNQLNDEQKNEFLKRVHECSKLLKEDFRLREKSEEIVGFANHNDSQGEMIRDTALRKLIFGDSGSPMFEKIYKDGFTPGNTEPKDKEKPKSGLRKVMSKLSKALSLESI